MKRVVRFGIVGCGVIASTHADVISQLDGGELVACCDILPQNATHFAERYGINKQHVHHSISSLLNDFEVDAVSVCTPSGTHSEIAVASLISGKSVLVEKPMDVTLSACSRLGSAQRETGLAVAVISQHRFDASAMYAHRLINTGALGALIACEAQIKWYRTQEYYDSGDWRGTWRFDGGGALMNQGIHTVDLMLWMMGEVATVFAVARTLGHERIEVEDVLCATVTFTNGAIGNLIASTALYPGFPAQLSVHGTLGSVVISGDALATVSLSGNEPVDDESRALLAAGQAGHALQVAQGGTRSAERQKEFPATGSLSRWGDAHKAQIDDFIESIHTGRTPRSNCETGEAAVAVILAAYESARTGKVVQMR